MPLVRVFVYGTLRRGGRYHDRFCRGAIRIEEASVRGRLEWLPEGYPMLEVPETDVLACGTGDPRADAARLEAIEAGALAAAHAPPDEAWPTVPGELMTFDDPLVRLPALDGLEGFRPGGSGSLYRRVALAVSPAGRCGRVAAWAYVRP